MKINNLSLFLYLNENNKYYQRSNKIGGAGVYNLGCGLGKCLRLEALIVDLM